MNLNSEINDFIEELLYSLDSYKKNIKKILIEVKNSNMLTICNF